MPLQYFGALYAMTIVMLVRFALCLTLAIALSSAAGERQELALFTEDSAPLSMTMDNVVTGLATDVLRKAFERSAIPFSIAAFPRQRSADQAQSHQNGCVYPLNRTPEREESYRWVGPLVFGGWALFSLKDRPLTAHSLKDLQGLRIGGTEADAITMFLKENAVPVIEVSAINADQILLKMLSSGRIDAWATGRVKAPYLAGRQHVALRELLLLKEIGVFLACNRAVAAGDIEKLDRAVRQIREDGTFDILVKAYR